jgi:hypothetical protein
VIGRDARTQCLVAAALLSLAAAEVPAQATFCQGLAATIVGTDGDDRLFGTKGDDVIVGLGGNDTIHGRHGDDVICAGDGDDRVLAGNGNDFVDGGIGDDSLSGGGDDDYLDGGTGADELSGGPGSDVCVNGTASQCEASDASRPMANAGPDQTALVGDTVILNGSGSSDPDGDPLTFVWSLISVPPGSAASLSDPTAVAPSFLIDLPGSYVGELIVNDGTQDSDPDTVTVTTDNSPPVADAGPDQTAFVGDEVILDGSGSSDVDGDPLTFVWSLTTVPAGSGAVLSDSSAVAPSFVVDLPGTYVAELVVDDGTVTSSPDTAAVTTLNSPPVADAGPDQSVFVGDVVVLDGSGSSDGDGDTLTYSWSLIAVPTGSGAVLSDGSVIMPTFVVDLPGTYVAQLLVNDGTVDSSPDTVTITTLNSVPVADAGPNQSVLVDDTVFLDGNGSSDADGDPLAFSWSLTTVPAGSAATLSDPAAVAPTFVADMVGTYVAQLIVNDGTVDSAPDAAMIEALNSAPVANAGPDQSVAFGEIVQLDGSGSSDPDDDPLTYAWSFVTLPAGASAALNDADTVNPTFLADVSGTYVVELIVNDGVSDSAPDEVIITATGEIPAIFIGDVLSAEGNSGTTDFVFDVALDAAHSIPVSVDFATEDSSATVADNDYVAASGTLTFTPGDTSKTITVQVIGDTTFEPNEVFRVLLSNPVNAGIGKGSGQGTIFDDDT